jgi:hypothetical protein
MNHHPPHRSRADLRPIFLVALLLHLLVAFVPVTAVGSGVATGPLHPQPGIGL